MTTISSKAAHEFLDAELERMKGLDFGEVREMPEGTALEAAQKFFSTEGVVKDRDCAAQLGLSNDYEGVMEMYKQLFALAREDPGLKDKLMQRLYGFAKMTFTTFQPAQLETEATVEIINASMEDMVKDEQLKESLRLLGEEYKGKDQATFMQAVAGPFATSLLSTMKRVTGGELTGPQGYIAYVMKTIELQADPEHKELFARAEKVKEEMLALMQVTTTA